MNGKSGLWRAGRRKAQVVVAMPRELLERIDDFRYARRIPSRAAAVRALIEIGLRRAPSRKGQARKAARGAPVA
jgi:metal-responsive CopG/Arc/MetJ family transcriptional regulator